VPPSARVAGVLGNLEIQERSCRTLPINQVRRRIVDAAVQEWGFFGFTVVDQTREDEQPSPRGRRRWPRLSTAESVRVAETIAGYWAITTEGDWIIENQNQQWNGPDGHGARWRDPWSAAFVSWVMCEGGLGNATQFRRAVAHHSYIDQAIRARDAAPAGAAFAAYDIGETVIVPGDLLCSGRRPAYRTLAERRRQMDEGARTHCDVVVKLDEASGRILTIGGNVRGAVSLKLLLAASAPDVGLRPERGASSLFAHLKLRAAPTPLDAFDSSPTMRALGCREGFRAPVQLAASNLLTPGGGRSPC
jgi:hypothetical protein